MVLAITPPAPVSMHFFILLAFKVGSAEAATRGFLMRTPQKLIFVAFASKTLWWRLRPSRP
jgi:hypothetical protein